MDDFKKLKQLFNPSHLWINFDLPEIKNSNFDLPEQPVRKISRTVRVSIRPPPVAISK